MKLPRFIRVLTRITCLTGFFTGAAFAQTTVYWDVNGATTGGSDGTTASATWSDSALNWGNAAGNIATAGWVAGNHANFSAGTGVTGSSTITISGTQVVNNITVDEGAITLTGGALSLSGTRSITIASGATAVFNTTVASTGGYALRGELTVTGAMSTTVAGNAIDISTGATNARLNVGTGGSFTASTGNVRLGVNGSTNTANTGALYQSGSSGVTAVGLVMGTASGTGAANSSYYRIADTSTLNVTNMVVASAGAESTSAAFDQAGGTVNVGAYVRIATATAASASMNLTGGTFNFNGTGATNDTSFVVGYASGRGELNVRDSAHLNLGTTSLRISGNAASTGLVALGTGGLISTGGVIAGGGSSRLAFDGGTLRATADSINFIGTANNFIHAGGARIDTNSFNVTIAQSLQAPAGNGVGSIAVANGGSGFVGAPLVSITGGGGTGATGYAVMNAAGTEVVSIVVTSSGSGYTSAPTITLVGGGGSGVVLGTANLAENISGTLTKIGSGILTLTAANTYAGGTFVNAGGVATGVTTGNFGTGNITVASGASLALGNASSIADAALLFFSQGASITLSGGTESLGNIVLGSTGIVASGLYTATQLNSYFGLTGGNEVFFGTGVYNVAASAIPEPSALALLAGITCAAACVLRRRR
ncbi:beta strand repeat-containing protein [Rariglobus hedericola]|nr:autotransporter-associated beta strand repeat-containing protein [Rariglobus hedericola]